MGKLRCSARPLRLIAIAAAIAAPAALELACAGGPKATSAPPPPARPSGKAFAPLTIKQDAKAPSQAVLLGTDEQDGSTIVPLPGASATGLVDAAYVKLGGKEPATGGTSPVALATATSLDGPAQVGGHGEPPGGAGPAWRASLAMSSFVAATTLGKDLIDFTFGASPGGYVDGASASGLLAGGFLAAITGAKIDPAATLAGTLNPDGTIGPVSGLPERFKGSLDKGKKRLGYPIGLRMARSAATGQLVDLVQLAKDRGAEAIEISDVHEAYKLLTGKALPAPVPVSEQEMRLDDATAKALDGTYREWQQRLAGEWSALLQLQQGGNLPPMLLRMAQRAQSLGEEAERLSKQGAAAAAYGEVLEAWVLAAAATRTFDVLQKVQQGDVPAAAAAVDQLGPRERDTRELLEQLGAMRPDTIGGHLLMMSAFQSALRGWGFQAFAADEVQRARRYLDGLAGERKDELASPAAADALVSAVAPAIVLLGRTYAEARKAQQQLEHEREKTLGYVGSLPNVKRLSASFQSASAAGVGYLDALLVEPLARSHGTSLDAARTHLAMSEPDYLVAYTLSHLPSRGGLPQELKQAWGEGSLAWNLMTLAGSELAYFVSAELIAKHEGLQVPHEKAHDQAYEKAYEKAYDEALARMLEAAAHTARASARAARIATGAIPIQAKLAYQQASAERDGGVRDKLEALSAYWMSSACSQTAVMLARN